jgi:hypothetical protein
MLQIGIHDHDGVSRRLPRPANIADSLRKFRLRAT